MTAAQGGALRLSGQVPGSKYKTEVGVVNVLATVRDRQGRIVPDLTREEFTIFENRRRQVIRYFAARSDLPLTLGLLFDVSGSQGRLLETERGASYRFLDQVLREGQDTAFVIHFAGEVEMLEDLSGSRKSLREALGRVGNPPPERGRARTRLNLPRGPWPQPLPGPSPGAGERRPQRLGGTSLYDAVFFAADELMRKRLGRKVLILISDGVDTSSEISGRKAMETAQRADTRVYSLHYSDKEANSSRIVFPGRRFERTFGDETMMRISRETGGGYFEPSDRQPIDKIFAQIEAELRNQYNLGYTPEMPVFPGEYRKIRVEVNRRRLTVQAREGYYAR